MRLIVFSSIIIVLACGLLSLVLNNYYAGIFTDISYEGKSIAQITQIQDHFVKTKGITVVFTLIAMGSGALAMFFLSSYILKPLSKIRNDLKSLGDGDFTKRFSTSRKDEIGMIS